MRFANFDARGPLKPSYRHDGVSTSPTMIGRWNRTSLFEWNEPSPGQPNWRPAKQQITHDGGATGAPYGLAPAWSSSSQSGFVSPIPAANFSTDRAVTSRLLIECPMRRSTPTFSRIAAIIASSRTASGMRASLTLTSAASGSMSDALVVASVTASSIIEH